MSTSLTSVSDILSIIKKLPVKDKIALSKAIDQEVLVERAKKLDKSIRANNISMLDIVTETKAARYERKRLRP